MNFCHHQKGIPVWPDRARCETGEQPVVSSPGAPTLPSGPWRGLGATFKEESQKPAPQLRGGEDMLPGMEGRAVRVLDAFFFKEF
jgi:hypothetical protein